MPTVMRMVQGLKGHRHVTLNKPVISRIYIVSHTWQLCFSQILVDGVTAASTLKLLLKIHQYLCNRTTDECFVRFSS